jgi:hypothetical protein
MLLVSPEIQIRWFAGHTPLDKRIRCIPGQPVAAVSRSATTKRQPGQTLCFEVPRPRAKPA